MAKTHFNSALVGNSSMLGCFSENGELIRLFWPNIDFPQHIDKMLSGIFIIGKDYSTNWLSGDSFSSNQQYIVDTNILKTDYESKTLGLKIQQVDYVLPHKDVLVRDYKIENIGSYEIDLGFIVYSAGMPNGYDRAGVLFDFDCDALIHYRHDYYISISSREDANQFQLGNNAYEAARSSRLNGFESIGMMNDSAASWDIGKINKGNSRNFTLYICAAGTLKEVKEITGEMRKADPKSNYQATKEHWLRFLSKTKKIVTGKAELDNLYIRSLLVFSLMSDKSGGLLASAELDEDFSKCGKYAYCWGRDAAFITSALDKCGLNEFVDEFYEWAIEVQGEDGSWYQRYSMDGNLAPSWGLQVDETGAIVWGIMQHYLATENIDFLRRMWEGVKKASDFMVGFVDTDTGLPAPSFDLWEERFGEHVYSSAAVYAGLQAGVKIAGILKITDCNFVKWSERAGEIKEAIIKNCWNEGWNRFIRSVRVKLNPWGEESTDSKVVVKVNPKGYERDLTLEDHVIDVSLLGLTVPFGVFDIDDSKMEGTLEAVESFLVSHNVGGLKRYENDNYIGGNPWIISTLWAALCHIKKGNYNKALEYIQWSAKGRTKLDLLPEQVDRDNGSPAWVIPLTWSHAMFVLVLTELYEKGEI